MIAAVANLYLSLFLKVSVLLPTLCSNVLVAAMYSNIVLHTCLSDCHKHKHSAALVLFTFCCDTTPASLMVDVFTFAFQVFILFHMLSDVLFIFVVQFCYDGFSNKFHYRCLVF